ncbi:MAG: alpha/beta fold hydrolase [Comamonadaceae bacterium]|jgi:S-formylglutathione hydrolase FrmB|nr:alpha/beta fold hydrolase [Comamonadaceae bacterium]
MPDRRQLLALGASPLFTPSRAAEPPAAGSRLIVSRLDGRRGRIDFQLYLPQGYEPEAAQRYPLLLLLHGRGDNMSAWTRIKSVLDDLIAAAVIPPLIAVMPDAPWSRRGGYYVDSAHVEGAPVESLLLDELLPHVEAQWPVRRDRESRVVGGYSMGGYGAMRFALARPQVFGAAIVLSPAVYTPLPPAGSSTREFGAFGCGHALFVDALYEASNYPALLAGRQGQAPALRLFIAAGDQEYKHPDPAESAHDIDMEAHKLFSRLSREPGAKAALRILAGGHDWSVWQPALREGLRWCARQLAW